MKKIFLLFCLFFLTGCDVEYNLTISNNVYDENIIMSFSKENSNYNDLLIYVNNKTPISSSSDEKKFYNSKILDNNDYYDLIYDYSHDINSIKNSYFINNCFPNFSLSDNDSEIIVSSGNNFSCFIGDDGLKADNVKINIKTDLKVLENDADVVQGNVYTWNINYDNYLSQSINMKLQKENVISLEKFKNEDSASYTFIIISIFIVVISVLIYLFIKFKRKKNNAI